MTNLTPAQIDEIERDIYNAEAFDLMRCWADDNGRKLLASHRAISTALAEAEKERDERKAFGEAAVSVAAKWEEVSTENFNRAETAEARCTALAEQVERLKTVLAACRDQFTFYASEHLKAGKWEKAETNDRFAKMCFAALSTQPPSGD